MAGVGAVGVGGLKPGGYGGTLGLNENIRVREGSHKAKCIGVSVARNEPQSGKALSL